MTLSIFQRILMNLFKEKLRWVLVLRKTSLIKLETIFFQWNKEHINLPSCKSEKRPIHARRKEPLQ